ncbi:MAG: protein kinase [Acidobacteriia bacterium]|nr:protein kinase [Terriglobia bacterium]
MKVEMKPERWQQIEHLYNSVVELEPSERGAYLKGACAGDESLQREVERLLAHQPQAEGFIESPALEVAARDLAMDPNGEQDLDLTGRSLSHYRVNEKIGEGGMGKVYRAFDDHLQRDIAIKLLPSGALADETARKRFRKEALALSKLNHPNIATVHDFDTQQGLDFLVMEYIPGVTLSEKLAAGHLSEKEVAGLGVQLAAGLEAAHQEGVLHRDLKPANIRLTPDGRLKILDFGLAKLIRMDTPDKSTESVVQTHGVAGTLPYMAPEQLQAEPLDARTDIFSAGTVLYEMTTGKRAFQETLTPRLIDAILHQAPPLPSVLNHRVSPGLEGVILKCLEKDPDNRYQSAKELGVDLRRLLSPGSSLQQASPRKLSTRKKVGLGVILCGFLLLALGLGFNLAGLRQRLLGGTGRQTIHSLAVLPLVNLSGDPGQEYFADGMTDEIITALWKIGALRVTARTSVMQYKESKATLSEIARNLKIDAVIEGAVLREGNQVRITARLMGVAPERPLWARDFVRDTTNILALQSEVAQAIVQEVRATITPQEQLRLAATHKVDPIAYDLYLQGRFWWNKRNEEAMLKARDYFQQSIDKDPTYASAWAGLADAISLLRDVGYWEIKPEEIRAQALKAALKAVELDDNLAEGHVALARVYMLQRKWAAAEKEFQQAIRLNPNYPTAHQWYAYLLLSLGRQEEGLSEIRKAELVDPKSMVIRTNVANHLWCLHRGDEAVVLLQQGIEIDPQFVNTHALLKIIYEERGMFPEAIQEFEKLYLLIMPREPERVQTMATGFREAYKAEGARGYRLRSLELANQEYQAGSAPAIQVAANYAQIGDVDHALQWLMKGCRDWEDVPIMLRWPEMNKVRADAHFREVLDCLGLEH